jgi:hypothetical protein
MQFQGHEKFQGYYNASEVARGDENPSLIMGLNAHLLKSKRVSRSPVERYRLTRRTVLRACLPVEHNSRHVDN